MSAITNSLVIGMRYYILYSQLIYTLINSLVMKHLFLIFSVIFSAIMFSNCKSDTATNVAENSDKSVVKTLADLRNAYTAEANTSTGSALVSGILKSLQGKSGVSDRQALLAEGYKVATEQKLSSRAAGFLFPILKESSKPATADQLHALGNLMKGMNKEAASNTVFQGLVDKFPNYSNIDVVKGMISTPIISIDDYIFGLGEKLFVDADNTGINKDAAMKYVDACEAYALAYPDNKGTADNLFKAAEVAKSIRTFPKSLSLYDWIIDKYPNYEKAPTALFLKGFIIENNVKDDKKAGEIYQSFLSKYPKHDLADDVEFLIENLGKSDQEILEMIEAKRKTVSGSK